VCSSLVALRDVHVLRVVLHERQLVQGLVLCAECEASRTPVNDRFVLFEPGITEYRLLSAERHHGERERV